MKRIGICCWLVMSATAYAQEFEMDLSEPKVPTQFRPTLLVFPVASADTEAANRAALLEPELIRVLGQGEQFSTVIEPSTARSRMEAADAGVSCETFQCFEEATRLAQADRALMLIVTKVPGGALLAVKGFDPARSELIEQTTEIADKNDAVRFSGMAGKSAAQRDKEFAQRAISVMTNILNALAAPNGELVVDNVDPTMACQVVAGH